MVGSPNKALLMLPLWYFARKLDSDDPDIVFKLKCAYYTVQCVILSIIFYLYTKALEFKKSKKGQEKVFVPKAAEPFSDPKAKKKYTEVEYGAHVISTVKSLASNTAIGTMIQTGLYSYKGMISGFATQSIMAPLNLTDNAAIRFFLMGDEKAFEVKSGEELTTEDEIVDNEGNNVVPSTKGVITSTKKKEVKKKKSFEDILLDTWDLGTEANVAPLMDALKKGNVNFETKENGWTPLMIMSGLGVKDVAAHLEKMKELGADPNIKDKEGWNALHWSAFHGCPDAARYILSQKGFDGISIGLHTVTDNEQKNALFHAKAESNLDVRGVIEEYTGPEETVIKGGDSDSGLRKRK